MKRGEMGRRGLSPLIATILLIAFAAALGTLIMTWALPDGQLRTADDPCLNVQLELQQLPGAQAICYSQNSREMRFIVKNVGETHVPALRLRITNRQFEITERDVRAQLEPGGAGNYHLEYNVPSPNGLIATIIPLVGDNLRACPAVEIEVSDISVC